MTPNTTPAIANLDSAVADGKLSASAAANIRQWLNEPRYAEYAPQVAEEIAAGKWKELDDAFWTVIPFGTGGRRGKMYPIGCNAINDRTIGESAQGLAEYVIECGARNAERGVKTGAPNVSGTPHSALRTPHLSCALAYDTRHNSRRFAELCASVMVANGFTVYFLDGYRSTPELSFLVRNKACDCGIMVTASHNPPSDNAVKVYWSTGGQIVPPHDKAIVERVMTVGEIKRVDFAQAVEDGKIVLCTDETDAAFIQNVASCGTPGPRDLKIIYSPLHGVGESAVVPALSADGFRDVEVYAPHQQPDGDFPNVPGHVSNPENPAVFDMIIGRAISRGADIVLATDPDCDRMGCAAPSIPRPPFRWCTFTGNQLGALLADYVCEVRKKAGTLTPEHYLVTTLVTTPLIRRIGTSYGVKTYDNLHVGFKWIAQQIDDGGPEKFLFGTEESHGYLIGQYARDKDGAAACMLMAELAAVTKAAKKTLWERLESLYWQHGYHGERQVNVFMAGSAGMTRMKTLMQRLREAPPPSLAGIAVQQVRDYLKLTPRGDMVILDLAEPGNFVAVRPSGTEPKVKFYLFTFVAPEQIHYLDESAAAMQERLSQMEADVKTFVDTIE